MKSELYISYTVSHHKTRVLYQIPLSATNVVWLWHVNSTWM